MTRPRTVRARSVAAGVTRDQALESLRASEERHRTVLKAAMDGFWLGDSSARLLEVNEAYCRMSGYSEEELLSMGVSDLEVQETPARIAARGRQARKHGPLLFQSRHRRKDGTAFDVEITLQFMAAEPGYFVAFLRDVTDRVQAQEKHQRFVQEIIAAREDERRRVSSALHHDVGSLTVGVSAYLEAVEAHLCAGESGKALAKLHQTQKLFDQGVFRLKTLAVQLRPPELDVLGICAALRQLFAQATRHGGPRIRFTETLGRKRVPETIATTLYRVAQEALTNAISHGHATRMEVDLKPFRGALTLTVRDHGQGFDPSDSPVQAPQMGLRVMSEMATAAGGTFTIASRPGKGATVRVSVPIQPERSRT